MHQEGLKAEVKETPVLLDTLKQQHKELVRIIGQVNAALTFGDQARVLAALSSLCQSLRSHTALEAQRLYPGLACAADTSGDFKMLETAYDFSNNMKRITESLQDFLSRHETSFHLERFHTCWNTLSEVLVRRIEAEDQTIYLLYERCVLASLPVQFSEGTPFAGKRFEDADPRSSRHWL
jgi:regulator of sigma D